MITDPRFIPRKGRREIPGASLSLAERDRRWKLTREEMDRRGIDCLVIMGRGNIGNGNVRWLDNGDFSERHMVFPKRGEPMTFWLLQNWGKWFTESCWEGVRYRGHEGKLSIVAAEAISDLGYQSGRIGIVGLIGAGYGSEGQIPYMTYKNLQRLLSGADFCDATDILTRLRMIKSAEEVAMLEKASELANIEIETALQHARPGVRESDLFLEMKYASGKQGGEVGSDQFMLINSGKGFPVNRHATAKILRQGEMVQFGHYARYGGYWSHPHCAISLGPMDDEYKPLRDAVHEGTQKALEVLKPGTPWSEVDRAIDEPVLRRGFYHEVPQIHATGLDGIEPPLTTVCAGDIPRDMPWREQGLEGSLEENEEWRELAGERYRFTEALQVEVGMSLAIEVKAAHEDRMALCFGPQVIIEENGPRVLTPDAMDVIELG